VICCGSTRPSTPWKAIQEDVLRVVGRTPAAQLIEVWLTEQADGEYDVWTAFEAGPASRARWISVFGKDR
jgi:hypothetical protein